MDLLRVLESDVLKRANRAVGVDGERCDSGRVVLLRALDECLIICDFDNGYVREQEPRLSCCCRWLMTLHRQMPCRRRFY